MKRLATALAAAAALTLTAAPAFAAPSITNTFADDSLLTQVFHGKPGWWTDAANWPAPPKGWKLAASDFPLLWSWPHKPATK
jgi:hypothetical protein